MISYVLGTPKLSGHYVTRGNLRSEPWVETHGYL
jgi:hypothetical protein